MTTVSRNALVPYSAGEMYSLINDIGAYPTFLPWCREARILYEDEDEIQATIRFSKHGIELSFTTKNRLQKNKMMEMRLVKGPFHHLQGFWRFEAMGETASKVSFDLEFELSSTLLGMAVGPVFTQIANALVDAFVKRAREVYGQRS